jgi:hypothetical protein
MPLKRDIIPHCALLSPAAASIGCVNTLSLQARGCCKSGDACSGEALIVGDNTDWAGMLACISRIIGSCTSGAPVTCAVVIGSGASARSAVFALAHLPQITCTYICNRTQHSAAALAAEFNVGSFSVGDDAPLGVLGQGIIVISTVSAGAYPKKSQARYIYTYIYMCVCVYICICIHKCRFIVVHHDDQKSFCPRQTSHHVNCFYCLSLPSNQVPSSASISLPRWLIASASALFDCAYSKTASTVRQQFEAAAIEHAFSSSKYAAEGVLQQSHPATPVVADGLLLLLEQALLQVPMLQTLVPQRQFHPLF